MKNRILPDKNEKDWWFYICYFKCRFLYSFNYTNNIYTAFYFFIDEEYYNKIRFKKGKDGISNINLILHIFYINIIIIFLLFFNDIIRYGSNYNVFKIIQSGIYKITFYEIIKKETGQTGGILSLEINKLIVGVNLSGTNNDGCKIIIISLI